MGVNTEERQWRYDSDIVLWYAGKDDLFIRSSRLLRDWRNRNISEALRWQPGYEEKGIISRVCVIHAAR